MTVDVAPKVYRIGEVAEMCGVSRQAIRWAEEHGRIPRAQREPFGDDRFYTERELEFIRRCFGRQ